MEKKKLNLKKWKRERKNGKNERIGIKPIRREKKRNYIN